MPFKNQTYSYRNKGGIRYYCECDILDESLGDLKTQAKTMVETARNNGSKAFYEKIDNFYRVFLQAHRQ